MTSLTKATDYAAAWSSRVPEAVAAHFAADGTIRINGGELLRGTAALIDMAAGFYADFPDLTVRCDSYRRSGSHALFAWTLDGHHAQTRNHVTVSGWEEWDLNGAGLVIRSLGWFDADDYQRQIDGT
ncbi:MAG: nuclear transport factor 2 family protein [Marinibacterium sp.]|nr:nuclear transport factor 2 family protein [Marinibacterium sp.]